MDNWKIENQINKSFLFYIYTLGYPGRGKFWAPTSTYNSLSITPAVCRECACVNVNAPIYALKANVSTHKEWSVFTHKKAYS